MTYRNLLIGCVALLSSLGTGAMGATMEYTYKCDNVGIPFSCTFDFDTDNQTVTIDNLGGIVNTAGGSLQSVNTVVAPFVDGVITIPCASVGAAADATLLGRCSAGDVYLQVGTKDWDDFGIFRVITDPLPEFKLYVSDDYSSIESRLDAGISIGGVYKMTDFGWVCFGSCDNNVTFRRETAPGEETVISNLYSSRGSDPAVDFTSRFDFDLEAGTVTISNLGGFCGQQGSDYIPASITVPYSNGEFVVPCGGLGPDAPNSTRLGEAYGMDVYLQVGTFAWTDDFFTYIQDPQEELKFKVSSDYATISAVVGEGVTVAGVLDYTDLAGVWACTARCTGGMVFTKVQTGSLWEVSTEALDFGETLVSLPVTKSLTIESAGDTDVEWTAVADSDMFEVSPASGTLEALGSQTIRVTYAPTEGGSHNATLTVKGGGSEYAVSLMGKASYPDADFSEIITEGDPSLITWDNTSPAPWACVDGEAIADSHAEESEGALSFTVGGSSPVRMTYDLVMNRDFNDTFSMRVLGRDLFSYHNRLTHTESHIVPPGVPVEWILSTGYYPEGKVRISNLRIEETAPWEGISPDASAVPLSGEGFINVDGTAVAYGNEAMLTISVNPAEESNLSFDYAAGSSSIEVLVGGSAAARIERGETGTFHYDFEPSGATSVTIKAVSADTAPESHGIISNIRFGKGRYFGEPTKYNAVVYSYLDSEGSYSKTDGMVYNYPVEVTLTSGGKASFKGLLPTEEDYTEIFEVEGYIENDEIHIPTVKNINLATLYAYDESTMESYPVYYNYRYWLTAGEIGTDMIQSRTDDELILKMSPDRKTLTPMSDFGIWATWSWEDQGIYAFYRADSQFVMEGTDAELSTTATAVDFGDMLANGYAYRRSFTVLSTGSDCEFSALTDEDEFEISPVAGVIKSGESQTFTVTFATENPGTRESLLTIYSEGNDILLPLTANVNPVPDYSSIVSRGSELISFDAKVEYPWILEDGAAWSTNSGIHNSESPLKLRFSIPEGKTGVFTIDGNYCFEPTYDAFQIRVNDGLVYSDHMHTEGINTSFPLAAGNYEVELVHVKDVKDQLWMPYDYSRVSDISLVLSEADIFANYTGLFFTNDAPVGEVVSDVVTLVNMGNKEIFIISVEGTDNFGGVMPENPVVAGKDATIDVPLTFTASQPGYYEGVVTIHTTGGDVEVPVSATADYVKYVGVADSGNMSGPYITALLQYGERNVCSTMWYPSAAMEHLAGCNIESLTFFSANLPDYSLTCPDVKAEVGETSETDIKELFSGLTQVMAGEMVDLDYWRHTIPFDEPYLYEGGNFVFQLSTAALENYGDHQPVQISYDHTRAIGGITVISLDGETADYPQHTVPVMMVKYAGEQVGTESIDADLADIVEIRYYSMEGLPLTAPVKGLNIVVTIYSDGSRRSSVMMK